MLVGLDLTDCTNIMTEKRIFIWNKNNKKSAHPESFYKPIAETRMQTHGRHIEKALWERLAISSCLSAQWDRSSKTGCVNPGPVQTNSKLIQGCQRANTNEWVDIKPAKRPQLDLSFIFFKALNNWVKLTFQQVAWCVCWQLCIWWCNLNRKDLMLNNT